MSETVRNQAEQDDLGEALREAMRSWATGVSVVSSRDGDSQHGMTVNSFTSVALLPPLVIVTLDTKARTHDLVKNSGVFGVSILHAGQEDVSDRFAGRHTEDSNRFAGYETEALLTGSPFIQGSMAYIDCRVKEMVAVGKNTLFIAEAVAVRMMPDASELGPLLYYDRGYRQIGD